MILDRPNRLISFLTKHPKTLAIPWDRVLMVSPDYFRVEYAINPYMRTPQGDLQVVDEALARDQWVALKQTYEKIGVRVEVLKGIAGLPDMVFAANQSFPFFDEKSNARKVLLSQMRSEQRKREVDAFSHWYRKQGYQVEALKGAWAFEGNGDALIQPGTGLVWGGYGPRTDRAVYEELSERFGLSIVPLELKSKDFYHLDTCFSILNAKTVAIQSDAFSEEGVELIRAGFPNVIEVDYEENLKCFACNCHSPNGVDVILQRGAFAFCKKLERQGFRIHEVETSEFMKSGGSVFCMKMLLFPA